jgi:hypothetical protein
VDVVEMLKQIIGKQSALPYVLVLLLVVFTLVMLWLGSARQKGKRGEKRVYNILSKSLPDGFIVLNDIYLPSSDGTTTQIDHIVVSQYGVFVVETKNYSGWIFANARDDEWTQVIYHRKSRFQNPLRQNYRHICALAECLGISKDYFHSVVAFTENCTFKTPMPDGVVHTVALADYIKSFDRVQIDPAQVPEVVDAIRKWAAEVGANPAKSHIASLKRKHGGAIPAFI